MVESRTLHPSILREYDIRGVVGDTLYPSDVESIAHGFGSALAENGGKKIVIGYDGRLHSPELEAAAVRGLMACGLHVIRVGCGPTPMLYFATHYFEVDSGMMITGSHNPPEYNGIKMVFQGKAFFGEDIKTLGKRIAAGKFIQADGYEESRNVLADYVARIVEGYSGLGDLKIAWDPGNGAAGDATRALMQLLPGTHVAINTDIDGTFPNHHPDPTVEQNLEQLKLLVAEEDCDLGIAFDGDGDRIGVLDNKSRVIWGDQLLVILARDVLADEPGATIIADVKAGQLFQDEITRLGGVPLMWKTGHSHIKSKLAEVRAPLAGEMSGHIFFKHRYYGFDDALYSAVRLISVIASSSSSLAEISDSLPLYINTPEIRFDCADDRKFAVVNEVRTRICANGKIRVNTIDGVRVETTDGWWLLRASNTQAVLVARCESNTKRGLKRLKDELARQVRLSGIIPPPI
ncbi:MAG: phosphomannomutase [Rhodospirillaceae bacterium TMED8]|nr:phosphomannomutase [Magnetovibrio sp.]OUT51965.1 MAG: phosphomannomutase [Rhodospirillaceae bacterium TMED8]|tara:strand:- start:153 stop:1538 length:1386 start_codon:yes stop_codon:yes gene_type:complete